LNLNAADVRGHLLRWARLVAMGPE